MDQTDFCTAFVQSTLPEPIYLELPPVGFHKNKELAGKVLKVNKSLNVVIDMLLNCGTIIYAKDLRIWNSEPLNMNRASSCKKAASLSPKLMME